MTDWTVFGRSPSASFLATRSTKRLLRWCALYINLDRRQDRKGGCFGRVWLTSSWSDQITVHWHFDTGCILSLSLSLTQKSAQKYTFSFKSGRHVFFCVEIFFQLSESNISRGCIACWTSLCKGSNLQWMMIFLVTLPSQAFMLSTPWTVKQGLCCSAAFDFFGVASKFKVSFQSRLAGLSVTFSFHLQNAWAAFKTLM